MSVPLRRRSFGELLGLCFTLPVAHFGKLFFILVVLGLPGLVLGMLLQDVAENPGQAPEELAASLGIMALLWISMMIVAFVIGPLQQAASILIISGSFIGRIHTLGESLALAARRILPLLLFSFITGLIIALGMFLLFVPGFILLTWYYVGAPALVVENLSWRDAMARSKSLSEGYRWWILLFFLVTVGIYLLLFVGMSSLLAVLLGEGLVFEIVGYLVQVICGMIAMVAPIVYYFQLRIVKEGFDVQSLVSIVDAIAARHETEH